MLEQLEYLICVWAITWYGLRALFGVIGFFFRLASPPIDRLDVWLKSKTPQPKANPRPEPPLRTYSGYDVRTR
jgi:hypothetical protein